MKNQIKGILIGFVLGIIMIQSAIFGLGALKKLWQIEQGFDQSRYADELDLKEQQELDDERKRRHEENRWAQ